MSKMSLQFHGTTKDIYDFVVSFFEYKSYNLYGVIISPIFIIDNITTGSTIKEFGRYNMVVISKEKINICNNYKDFIFEQDNNLCITIGYNNHDIIKESIMWIKSKDDIDKDWKKVINNFKKSLLRGAWVVNPNNQNKTYYKNHKYTINAKQAYEKGTLICPIAGWNKYELVSEEFVSE